VIDELAEVRVGRGDGGVTGVGRLAGAGVAHGPTELDQGVARLLRCGQQVGVIVLEPREQVAEGMQVRPQRRGERPRELGVVAGEDRIGHLDCVEAHDRSVE
jgi:hypothetical protein